MGIGNISKMGATSLYAVHPKGLAEWNKECCCDCDWSPPLALETTVH